MTSSNIGSAVPSSAVGTPPAAPAGSAAGARQAADTAAPAEVAAAVIEDATTIETLERPESLRKKLEGYAADGEVQQLGLPGFRRDDVREAIARQGSGAVATLAERARGLDRAIAELRRQGAREDDPALQSLIAQKAFAERALQLLRGDATVQRLLRRIEAQAAQGIDAAKTRELEQLLARLDEPAFADTAAARKLAGDQILSRGAGAAPELQARADALATEIKRLEAAGASARNPALTRLREQKDVLDRAIAQLAGDPHLRQALEELAAVRARKARVPAQLERRIRERLNDPLVRDPADTALDGIIRRGAGAIQELKDQVARLRREEARQGALGFTSRETVKQRKDFEALVATLEGAGGQELLREIAAHTAKGGRAQDAPAYRRLADGLRAAVAVDEWLTPASATGSRASGQSSSGRQRRP